MPNYFYYNYLTSKICEVKEDESTYVSSSNMNTYLNALCLENGSTYLGRKEAFRYQMRQKKFTPIYVSKDILYFPTESLKNPNCVWINYHEIESIEYKEKACNIFFKDHTCLVCLHPNRIHNSVRLIQRFLRL